MEKRAFDIVLTVCVGELHFEMPRAAVRAFLGDFTEYKHKGYANTADDFIYCQAYYTADGLLDAIGFDTETNTVLKLNGVSLFDMEYNAFLRYIMSVGKGFEKKEKQCCGHVNGLSYYAPQYKIKNIILTSSTHPC